MIVIRKTVCFVLICGAPTPLAFAASRINFFDWFHGSACFSQHDCGITLETPVPFRPLTISLENQTRSASEGGTDTFQSPAQNLYPLKSMRSLGRQLTITPRYMPFLLQPEERTTQGQIGRSAYGTKLKVHVEATSKSRKKSLDQFLLLRSVYGPLETDNFTFSGNGQPWSPETASRVLHASSDSWEAFLLNQKLPEFPTPGFHLRWVGYISEGNKKEAVLSGGITFHLNPGIPEKDDYKYEEEYVPGWYCHVREKFRRQKLASKLEQEVLIQLMPHLMGKPLVAKIKKNNTVSKLFHTRIGYTKINNKDLKDSAKEGSEYDYYYKWVLPIEQTEQ